MGFPESYLGARALMGTPTDLRRYINVDKPVLRVKYEYEEMEPGTLIGLLEEILP